MSNPKLHSKTIGIEIIEEDGILKPVIVYRKGKQWLSPLLSESFLGIDTEWESYPFNIESAKRVEDKIIINGTKEFQQYVLQMTGSFEIKKGLVETISANIKIKLIKGTKLKLRFESVWNVQDSGIPRWMVPGIFYKHNRPPGCVTLYPAYQFEGGDSKSFISNQWYFRSDRCTVPSVFCWSQNYTTALVWNSTHQSSEEVSLDDTGIGFQGNTDGTTISLTYPYQEYPVKHSGFGKGNEYHDFKGTDAELRFTEMNHGDEIALSFQIYGGEYDLHAYDAIIRDIYYEWREKSLPNPWMSKEQAAKLTSYALMNWHFDEKEKVLYETCAFDSYFGKGKKQVDRPHMHVSWVSGLPYCYALMKMQKAYPVPQRTQIYTIKKTKEQMSFTYPEINYAGCGKQVMNKITEEGISPCEFFYPEWTKETGWGTGWNPNPSWIQSRTIAECVLFLLRAIELDKRSHFAHDDPWSKAAKKNLDLIVRRQNKDGNYGSYYDLKDGKVIEWEGAGGLLWIPALLLASELFKEETYRASALSAAEYYKKFVEDDYIYGAPEDVHLCPTSEDAYNAVMAYTAVYDGTGDKQWLAIAKRAADWMETWRFTYNITFPRHTILEKYDYRTVGGDIASPSNQHIHNYGMICVLEVLKLWEWTEDDYYLDRLKDNLLCFHQFIARRDGDFGAMMGMVTERWFHTEWDHAKGDMLQLAHAWCTGLILYANISIHEFGDILVNVDSGKVHVLESIKVSKIKSLENQIEFRLTNPYFETLDLALAIYSKKGIVQVKGNKKDIPAGVSEEIKLAIKPKYKTKFSIKVPAKGTLHLVCKTGK